MRYFFRTGRVNFDENQYLPEPASSVLILRVDPIKPEDIIRSEVTGLAEVDLMKDGKFLGCLFDIFSIEKLRR